MEIRLKIKLVVLWKTIILLGIIVLLSACFHSKKEAVSSIAIIPDEHTLLAITPEFSIKMAGNTLNKHYLRLKSGKIFPMTGILQSAGMPDHSYSSGYMSCLSNRLMRRHMHYYLCLKIKFMTVFFKELFF